MKFNFLGDSITEGACAEKVENKYTYLVSKYFGAEELNFGVSGTRIARQKKRTQNYDDVFMERAVKMPTDADFTFVFGGTNDFGHGDAELGDFSSEDSYTFYGAMKELARFLSQNFPKEKVCFILPLPRCDQDNPYGDGSKDQPIAPLSAYINAQKEVLDYYGVEYLDLTDKFYIPQKLEKDELFADGLHPNPKGYAYLSEILIKYLERKGFKKGQE